MPQCPQQQSDLQLYTPPLVPMGSRFFGKTVHCTIVVRRGRASVRCSSPHPFLACTQRRRHENDAVTAHVKHVDRAFRHLDVLLVRVLVVLYCCDGLLDLAEDHVQVLIVCLLTTHAPMHAKLRQQQDHPAPLRALRAAAAAHANACC